MDTEAMTPPRRPGQVARDEPRRPLVRYHGGKWMLAPWIISHFPEHRRYVEPFGGGASVLLRKSRSFTEVYNDLDSEIVNLFRVCRDDGENLVRALSLTPFSRSEFRASYLPAGDPLEMARRTIIRSFQGFGSDGIHSHHVTGFRGFSERSGTTPAHDWANFPKALRLILSRMQGVVIEHQDALHILRKYDGPDALHYADPPYVHSTRTCVDAGRGYRHEMADEQHRELAEVLHTLKGAVVLSGYHSPLYDGLYAHWRRVERASLADGALKRTEVLWMNYAATDDLFANANLF
jgi:DNA adenine methylase